MNLSRDIEKYGYKIEVSSDELASMMRPEDIIRFVVDRIADKVYEDYREQILKSIKPEDVVKMSKEKLSNRLVKEIGFKITESK